MTPGGRIVLLTAALCLPAFGVHGQVADTDGEALERVYYDGLDDQGRLTGGMLVVPVPDLGGVALGPFPADWTTIVDNGPSANRIDFVFVGDGYLQSELGSYAAHVDNGLADMLSQEPFLTYSNYFNFHRVDVISNESGVDNDPVQGITKDTALNMGFWCSGIERLLCVSVSLAYQYAANAPEVDHVLAVANSTKYGGAGYSSSDLATYSGGNGAAPEVAIHEVGHSLGNLADEYDYNDGTTYSGGETPERNTSILDAPAMGAAGTKWADWLGDPGVGFAGPVSTFEGAAYYEYGIYRPTFNSKMRSLGVPFNLPSAEGLIIEIYKLVDIVDDRTPTGPVLDGGEHLFVTPLEPIGHELEIQWYADGAPIDGATCGGLDLPALHLTPGAHSISVTVRDPTELVRDEAARDLYMTRTISWSADVAPLAGDIDQDGTVSVTDLLALLGSWGLCPNPCPPSCAADIDGDCAVTTTDLLVMLAGWTTTSATDCNGNGTPDECETDCNGNGVPDDCDIAGRTSDDCNGNGTPDECEADCNGNGVPDDCDIAGGTSDDCNANGIPDECEADCNGNGAPDDCDVADMTSPDCNGNGIPDECDLAAGTSPDVNANGVPDECEGPPANNACGAALPITVGATPFDTWFATTDGLPLVCQGQSAPFVNDVWFTWTPQRTGTATIETCGNADFDTIIAVYFATGCPPNAPVACSNDAAGCGLTSSIELQVFTGIPYLIRLGGTQGSGSGVLTIDCVE